MTRATLLSLALLAMGGPGAILSARRLGRALRFRFQRGRPYIPGSIRRTALATVVFSGMGLLGAALAATVWLTRDLQAIHGVTRAGEVRVLEQGGALLLELRTGPEGGNRPVMAAGLAGPTWMVTGTVISFPPWLRPAGLEACHGLVQAGDLEADPRPPPAVLARAATLFRRVPAWAGVEVRRRSLGGRGPLPEWTAIMASRDGYFLGPARPLPGADGSG